MKRAAFFLCLVALGLDGASCEDPTGIVRLDADSANADLVVNEDGTCVENRAIQHPVAEGPERFLKAPAVVGRRGYDSGTDHWLVEVTTVCDDTPLFCLGVIGASVNRKEEYNESPQTRVWALEDNNGTYTAYTDPLTPLPKREKVTNFRLNLDYTAGTLTFSDPESHIYTFTGTFYNEKVYPYFWVGKCVKMCLK